ncbi:hypothetical protein BaRGS_00017714 [Batillaria attramentaria]|uniref:Ig-like domain-containing protein n=1 Tax=Batillaria attramentaria TaxID=370345 RepID=A0ABD0KUR2_9CAEN
MILTFAVCFLAVVNIQVTSALQWTSALDLPANVTVHACIGDNVTLPWKYETEGAEHAIDVEWLYQAEGQAEELIATYVRGNFFLAPTAKQQHVQFVPNAGLEMMHVTRQDSGAYILNVNTNLHGSAVIYSQRVVLEVSRAPATSDGQWHVHLVPRAVQDNVTGEWHVMLSCGTFSSLGQPPVSVLWTTPDNVTVPSSYYDNAGNYILIVDNPVATGEYSCRLEQTPSAMCLPAQSLLHNGASIHVDGVETRLSVLEGQLVALQNENAVTSALKWTSDLDLPANATVHACTGDNVTLPWKFETEAAEHAIDVEWLYQAEGQAEEVIASHIRGNFLLSPTAKQQHVQFVPNAGLELMHVTQEDSGAYILNVNINLHGSVVMYSQRVILEVSSAPASSSGHLHVQLMPSAVQDNVTGEWHVMLSCGTFSNLGQPPVSVLWTTPDNVTVPSSYYDNAGNYILIVDNPVATGEYSCRLELTPSAMCLPAQSLLHNGASIHVDGVETRLSVLEGQLVAMQNENAELKSELSQQQNENENNTAALEGQLTVLQSQVSGLLSSRSILDALVNIQVTSALQWKSALDLPANATVHACIGDNVTLPWKFETEGAEHAIDVEWLYQAEGQAEELIATYVRGNFFLAPTAKQQHVQFVPNAGLEMMHVTRQDSGAYILNVNTNLHGSAVIYSQRVVLEVSSAPATSDGQLHVHLVPRAVQDNVTGEWHVMLSCGTFSSLGQPPVSVLWTTPDNVTVSSSYYDNAGNYILIVDNPVATGEYSCLLEQTPSALRKHPC